MRLRARLLWLSTFGAVAAVVSLLAIILGLGVEIATAGAVSRVTAAAVALAAGGGYWLASGWVIRRQQRRAADG